MKSFLLNLCLAWSILSSSVFAQVDLKKKIASMVMVGFGGTTVPDSLKKDLSIRGLGNVILFAGNVSSPQQLKSLTTELQSYSTTPLFIAIDQEGGKVARLSTKNGFDTSYTAYNLGTIIHRQDTTAFWSGKMAQWLEVGGINLNLAPVVDVNINPLSPAIGGKDRSFSKDPYIVFNHANTFIKEFSKRNIITALKHFPGHGSASADSHFGFTDVSNTWTENELIPYRFFIQNNYQGFIMSGHMFNNKIDSVYPASLSKKTLIDLLKVKMGFKGVVITDGLFMNAISNNYSFDEIIELAINAGNDVLLYTTNLLNGTSLLDSVVNIVYNKVQSGRITEARIDESYTKLMKLKQSYLNIEDNKNVILADYSLRNYPNPFNPVTTIEYNLPEPGNIIIKVYDVLGKEIQTTLNEYKEKGVHKIIFDGSGLSAGIYIYTLQAGNTRLVNKFILLK